MPRSPIATGAMFAILAAVTFGVTTPVVAWAGRDIGPLTTAALLYGGAAIAAALLRIGSHRHDAPVRRTDVPRLIAVALVGGALAPTLLVWGLQRAGATAGSLLLNLEAVFTVILARALFHESIGRRVAVAVLVMTAGGAALTVDVARGGEVGIVGALAVIAATAAWATDNTLTRPLAERDPLQVILVKAGLGASITGGIAYLRGELVPPGVETAALLVCGATGYGASLFLYLLAQRRIGAGRTGSIFALAPFVGAALAWSLGDRDAGALTVLAAVLFIAGVYLHLTEKHGHRHVHDALEHEHMHRHDDGHHTHSHEPPFAGAHAHPHRHERVEHEHDHAPDVHHVHRH